MLLFTGGHARYQFVSLIHSFHLLHLTKDVHLIVLGVLHDLYLIIYLILNDMELVLALWYNVIFVDTRRGCTGNGKRLLRFGAFFTYRVQIELIWVHYLF